MTSRKRSGSGSSKRPKEKVVYIYELFLRGEDPTINSSEFWNEFFLLQPNVDALENEITKLTSEQFSMVKKNLTMIFQKCIDMLETGKKLNKYFIYVEERWGSKTSKIENDSISRSSQALVSQFTDFVFLILCYIQEIVG